MGDAAMDDDEGATFSELEALEEDTPHDHASGPPVVHVPKGPPPPRPLFTFSQPAADPEVRDGTHSDNSDSDSSGSERHRRWPILEVVENGQRTYERVEGPHLPNGRFAETSSETTDAAADDDCAEEAAGDGASEGEISLNSFTYSTTSLVLEGPSLQAAVEFYLGQLRLELFELHPDLTSRSHGARIGAMRKRAARLRWVDLQNLARDTLSGTRLQRWTEWDYQATHEYRPRRRQDEP